jgi:endonuclease-3
LRVGVSENPLELLIATILSAQCTDKQVNKVTEGLFQKYRTAADYASAEPAALEQDIRRIGLFRSKAKNIRSACQALVSRHGGEIPRTLEELTALDGVGRKTANVCPGTRSDSRKASSWTLHVARLSQRLRMTSETDPVKIEAALIKLVPRTQWTQFSHQLIWHGRRRCFARNPDCAQCGLQPLCPSVKNANSGKRAFRPPIEDSRSGRFESSTLHRTTSPSGFLRIARSGRFRNRTNAAS